MDVHPRKKFSFSSERLSETVSQFSERSTTVSLADETGGGNSVAASTRALAGSLLAYRVSTDYFGVEKVEKISKKKTSKYILKKNPKNIYDFFLGYF